MEVHVHGVDGRGVEIARFVCSIPERRLLILLAGLSWSIRLRRNDIRLVLYGSKHYHYSKI